MPVPSESVRLGLTLAGAGGYACMIVLHLASVSHQPKRAPRRGVGPVYAFIRRHRPRLNITQLTPASTVYASNTATNTPFCPSVV